MTIYNPRISWDTTVKHYVRNGLYDNLPDNLKVQISRTNKHRWQNETADKYNGCEVANYISKELDLIKKIGQSQNSKKVLETYFKLSDVYREITGSLNGLRQKIAERKETIVNVIESVKNTLPVESALKIFNISRSTYHNYKTLVINKCESSYFQWCLKRYPHQLLNSEINKIESYFKDENYKY